MTLVSRPSHPHKSKLKNNIETHFLINSMLNDEIKKKLMQKIYKKRIDINSG